MNDVDIQRDRIFVSIAAYRDPDTRNTINDMFAKATYKERVFAGVFSQIDHRTDLGYLIGQRRNVREMVTDSRDAKGCTWARNTILTNLRKDEEFVLQIDAHSRFDIGWDVRVLEEYKKLPKHDCILTSYPPAFNPFEKLDTTPKHSFIKFRDWHNSGLPIFMADVRTSPEFLISPSITPGVSAGCLFGPSNIFDRVPYDPYVYFFGEEQSYAIRLFTHGVDIYNPRQTFVYHHYYDSAKDKKNLHWSDSQDDSLKQSASKGMERVKYILGMSDHFPQDNAEEIGKYGIGNKRSVAQWEAFAGVNLRTQEMSNKAYVGNYKDHPYPY